MLRPLPVSPVMSKPFASNEGRERLEKLGFVCVVLVEVDSKELEWAFRIQARQQPKRRQRARSLDRLLRNVWAPGTQARGALMQGTPLSQRQSSHLPSQTQTG